MIERSFSLHWQPGMECRIQSLGKDKITAQRLAQMGVMAGSHLLLVHVSPFRGTLEMSTGHGQLFALREEELAGLECEFIAMSLSAASGMPDKIWRIRQLNGGYTFQQRMKRQHLEPQAQVRFLGPLLNRFELKIMPGGPQVTVGKGEADKIIVEVVNNE